MNAHSRIINLVQGEYTLRPLAEVQDYIKLLFQASFGMEHIIGDSEAFKQYVIAEIEEISPVSNQALFESITVSSPVGRINLAAALARRISAEKICRWTHESVKVFKPVTEEKFKIYLEDLRKVLKTLSVPMSSHEIDTVLDTYIASNCPPLHHSETYRRKYAPHYRLIHPLFIDKLTSTY